MTEHEKKWTTGKWVYDSDGFIRAGDKALAFVGGPEENGAILAAAPALYEALKMMLESHDRSCAGEDCQISGVDLARAALARARGERK